MLKVKNNQIYITRGDSGYITVVPQETIGDSTKDYELKMGDKIIFRLKARPEDSCAVICEKNCDVNINNNTALLRIEPEDTSKCGFREYRYEMELVTHDGFHSTFIENQSFIVGRELEIHDEEFESFE